MNIKNIVLSVVALATMLLAVATKAQVYFVHNDHLGAQKLTNSEKEVVWQAKRKPFGETEAVVETVTFNHRFPGQYFDKESGLHQNYFRDYDPSLGRYIQSDPIGLRGGLNTYVYTDGNPVSRIDEKGQLWFLAFAFGGGSGAAATAASGSVVAGSGFLSTMLGGIALGTLLSTPGDSESSSAEARKDSQHARYHRVCDQPPPPPSGDKCADAKRRRDQAQMCYDLRKNWSDKWDKVGSSAWNKHQSQLQQVKQRIARAANDLKRNCNKDC
ncbi:MAG: hypothetical protein MK185_15795 [Saccharospirillaceae bacterium]|nr:hypothetical protein [Saccharospirillaceae bacterium]